MCRTSSEDECELKEYCNGTSGECTANQWVMDGHPCSRNTAFCYRGVCLTADKQCQDIFGKGKGNRVLQGGCLLRVKCKAVDKNHQNRKPWQPSLCAGKNRQQEWKKTCVGRSLDFSLVAQS